MVRGEQFLLPNATTEQQIPVLVNGAPLRDQQGGLHGGVAVFQDISPIKELERQKDAFLAAASHDLKNPLTAIKARAQILQRQAMRMKDAEEAAGGRRPARDRPDGHPADGDDQRAPGRGPTSDGPAAAAGPPADRPGRDRAPGHRRAPAVNRPPRHRDQGARPKRILGLWDRARLERVVTNLVSNAIKFSPEGGRVSLVVREEERERRAVGRPGGPRRGRRHTDRGRAADLRTVLPWEQRGRRDRGDRARA